MDNNFNIFITFYEKSNVEIGRRRTHKKGVPAQDAEEAPSVSTTELTRNRN